MKQMLSGEDILKLTIDLTNLQELNLKKQKFTEINDNIFNGLYNLEKLDLSDNKIVTIKANAFAFEQFTRIKFVSKSIV